MKKTLLYVFATVILASCSGNGNQQQTGTKFAAKERTSSLSSDEREEAIAAKKASLTQEINIDSILNLHGIAFSVLPPAIDKNVPQAASNKLGTRMIQIACQNGIGGLCTNPVLAMVSRVDCVQRELTGTAPQKAIVKYEITMYCGNFVTNDIYASSSQTITGVGASFEDAANTAMNELKNTTEVQKMLSTASERALSWYSSTSNVQKLVDNAVADRNYALAMALLSSVPEQATATYAYATKKNAEVSELFFQDKAAEFLGAMEGAIADGGDEYNPEVGAYLQLISPRSSSYARAKQLYDQYINRMQTVRDDVRDKEHRLAMEQMQVDKIRAKYEGEATIEQIKADSRVNEAKAKNTGGFLGLGKLWDGMFGLTNRLLDGK